MNFLKAFLTSCLGTIIGIIALILVTVFIISLSGGEEIIVNDNSVLKLDLDTQIIEADKEDPFAGLPFFGGSAPRPIGLAQLRQTLAHAKSDSKIKGVLLNVSYPAAGYSVIEEIREALTDFRSEGKWVIAYSEVMTEQAYYLASAADKVYLAPEGEMEFNGLAVEMSFFKRLFDKLEIKPEIFRVGEYKSAVEPFMLDKMSDANRLQLTEMIESIYDQVLTGISASRNIPKEKLAEISDKMLVRNAALAVEHGLVDSLLYQDQVEAELKHRLSLGDDKDIEYIKYSQYKRSFSNYSDSKNEIAVIVAEGTILPGKGDRGQEVIGSESFSKEIRKARENDKVKAIVVRINSPGGSALASDVMWREITLTTKVKPVIASMSTYAASGGYYMAMGCDTIVAQPHTITGSIGVFSVLYDASGFLSNKIGITSQELKTGEIGELFTVTRPLTDAEKAIWQKRTDEVYEAFTSKAAEGRKMSVDAIKQVASGRVWTGAQAKERGLVDIVGSFEDAVKVAASAAKVQDDYKVKFYPQYTPGFFEQLVEQFDEEDAQADAMKKQLGEQYYLYQQWKHVRSYEGVQARMPFEMNIH